MFVPFIYVLVHIKLNTKIIIPHDLPDPNHNVHCTINIVSLVSFWIPLNCAINQVTCMQSWARAFFYLRAWAFALLGGTASRIHRLDRTAKTGMPGQDSQDRTARTGWPGPALPEQDIQNSTARTGEPRHYSQKPETGQAEQKGQKRTGRTERTEKNGQNRKDRKGQAEQDRQNRKERKGQAEQKGKKRTGKTGQEEQYRQNRTGRAGQEEKDRQKRTGRKGQEGRTGRAGLSG
jgi:hypothetical protein